MEKEGAPGIPKFESVPSADEFTSKIEPKNIPSELVASSTVEVMLSKSAPVFYGDIRSHDRVSLPFSTFIGYCKEFLLQRKKDRDACFSTEKDFPDSFETEEDDPRQIYLAQVPIMNIEKEERVQLENLIEDIQTPLFLKSKTLTSINLWMNGAQTRSSTHYDPHHNLLCVVSGRKQVDLWSPSSSPFLYPMPLYGEASNHSAVPIDELDISLHPRAEHLKKYSQRVILQAGDALFIPEGWFHQVDSESLTIAVNFWWRSEMMSDMPEHMDSYYLRRILKRLTDKEMNQMLCKTMSCASNKPSHVQSDENDCSLSVNNVKDSAENTLHDLEPSALRSLHELVSLVHDKINADDLSNVEKTERKEIVISELYYLEEDPVANIFWALEPLNLQKMFLALVHHFPRTLEALVLHMVSPVGAEVLTRKFDEMDQLINEEDRNEFYRAFYGVFDDQFAVMDRLLNGKESFSRQAFKNVMDKFLGVKVQ